jgi:hypothetical protein
MALAGLCLNLVLEVAWAGRRAELPVPAAPDKAVHVRACTRKNPQRNVGLGRVVYSRPACAALSCGGQLAVLDGKLARQQRDTCGFARTAPIPC